MAKTPAHYLVKSEPYKYPFAQLCRDGQTRWDGVRSFEARNNLRAMRVGDLVLFYHSNEGKEIVGVTQVVTAAYPDPTAPGEDWSVVDLAPVVALVRPVTLATIKAEPRLADLNLVRKSRVSVVPILATEFALLLRMSGTKLPATPTLSAESTAPSTEKPASAKPPAALPGQKIVAAKSRPTKPAPKPRRASAAAKSPATKPAAPKSRPAKSAAAKPRPTKPPAPKSRPAKPAAGKSRPTASTKLRTAAP